MRLVQLNRGGERRVAVVENAQLQLLTAASPSSIYALAQKAIQDKERLSTTVAKHLGQETLAYDPIYAGDSDWRLLPSFDHPDDA